MRITLALLVSPLLLVVLEVYPARAQQPFVDAINRYATAARNTWEQRIKPKFVAVMSPRDRAIVDDIDFEFPAEPGAFDAFATTRGGQREIVISAGFVAYQDAAIDGLITAEKFKKVDRFLPYLQFADQQGDLNVALHNTGQPPKLVPRFATFAQIDPQAYADYAGSTAYNNLTMSYRINSLAYVLGHEIGHHIDGDHGNASDREQVGKEFRADLYSVRLLLRAGFSPLAAGPLMMFFHEGGPDTRHPPPLCRLITFTTLGLPTIMVDPGFQRFLKENPDQKAAIEKTRAFIVSHKPEIQASCGGWVVFN